MEKLFYKYEQMWKKLVKRENITVEQFYVEEVAGYIEKKVIEVKGKPFEEVCIFLLELSALFGAVVNQLYPCYWTLNEFLILSYDPRLTFEGHIRKTAFFFFYITYFFSFIYYERNTQSNY